MGRPQLRQRARSRIQERSGMLSYQAIGLPQRGQRLPGETMLCRLGTRAITTLRKLPTTAPVAKTQMVTNTGMPRARSCISAPRSGHYDVAALPRAREMNNSSSDRRCGVSDTIVAPEDTAADSAARARPSSRSEEHTSELQSRQYLVCRLLLEKKKNTK